MDRCAHRLIPLSFFVSAVLAGCTQVDSKTTPHGVPTGRDSSSAAVSQPSGESDTLAARDRSQWRPRMPMVRAGSCPGEDCSYGNLVVACEDLALISTDSSGAKPIGITVHEGDTVTLVTGNLHLLEPGIVLIKRDYAITDYTNEGDGSKSPRPDTLRFFAGDTLYVLDYLELGDWNWWYRGKPGAGHEFWTRKFQRSFRPGDDQRPAVAISKPRGEWWYKLQVDVGNEGGWMRGGQGRWVDRKFIPLGSDSKCGSDRPEAE